MTVPPRPGMPERQGLPRDLAELLHELLAAFQRYTMYPAGHPLLEPAVDVLARRVETALLDRTLVAIGIMPDALVVSGIAAPAT
ncbi:MAG: hypothetical protein M3Y31_10065, partial [Gemmatimonadota bacterium]|nr:hypothetical protein [Gemmatimonadota bacterium]